MVSYTTVSPLPVPELKPEPSAVCSLWHFPEVAPAGISPVARSVESGLSSDRPLKRPTGVSLALSFRILALQASDTPMACCRDRCPLSAQTPEALAVAAGAAEVYPIGLPPHGISSHTKEPSAARAEPAMDNPD